MRLISRNTLSAYWTAHPETETALRGWEVRLRKAQWTTMDEAKAAFSKAKTLNGERMRFEIKGGDYRMIVAFDFAKQIAFVKFIGTHAEYDRIDALTVNLF